MCKTKVLVVMLILFIDFTLSIHIKILTLSKIKCRIEMDRLKVALKRRRQTAGREFLNDMWFMKGAACK